MVRWALLEVYSQVARKLGSSAGFPARLLSIARTVAGKTRSDFFCPADLAETLQQVAMGRWSSDGQLARVNLCLARVAGLLRSLAELLRNVAELLRDVAALSRNAAALLRKAAGLLRNAAELLRDAAELFRKVAEVLRKVAGLR